MPFFERIHGWLCAKFSAGVICGVGLRCFGRLDCGRCRLRDGQLCYFARRDLEMQHCRLRGMG